MEPTVSSNGNGISLEKSLTVWKIYLSGLPVNVMSFECSFISIDCILIEIEVKYKLYYIRGGEECVMKICGAGIGSAYRLSHHLNKRR